MDSEPSGTALPQSTRREITAFLTGAAVVLVLSLVISALQFAGIISMAVAHMLLALAWFIAAVALWESPYEVRVRLVSVLVLSIGLFLLDHWMVQKRAELDAADSPKGSLRYAKLDIPQKYAAIGVGKSFGINLYFLNPGPGRVLNHVVFDRSFVEEADEQADHRVKMLFEEELASSREQYLAGKIEGAGVDPGEGVWMTVSTPPLTQQQIEGVFKGTTRLYFVVWLAWTDKQGRQDSLYRCLWLQGESLPPSHLTKDLIWHLCAGF